MHKRIRILVAVLLVLSIANYSRLGTTRNTSSVEFVSIIVMGALAGILLTDLMSMMRKK